MLPLSFSPGVDPLKQKRILSLKYDENFGVTPKVSTTLAVTNKMLKLNGFATFPSEIGNKGNSTLLLPLNIRYGYCTQNDSGSVTAI